MIRTPPGWGVDVLSHAYRSITTVRPDWSKRVSAPPAVQRIDVSDLRWALARGMEDFGASRTDVIFLCVIYPLVGLLLARVASGTTCCRWCSRWHPASRWWGRSPRSD